MLKKFIKLLVVIVICFSSLDKDIDNYIDNNINLDNSSVVDSSKVNDKYLGILEIKSIKLKRGFYDINSKLNDVDKNIEVIKSSLMPNIKNSNLILASHSGNSDISYFKNLDKLKLGDIASVYYHKNKYDYKLVNYYEVIKSGKVQIIKNNDVNNLTLITCKKNSDKQIVYIFELIRIEER